MQVRGTYNDKSDAPVVCNKLKKLSDFVCNSLMQVSDTLIKIHFAAVDVEKLTTWIQKWPFGTAKDGYGLPKTMLPMTAEVRGGGIKISFKGTPDPWLQVHGLKLPVLCFDFVLDRLQTKIFSLSLGTRGR